MSYTEPINKNELPPLKTQLKQRTLELNTLLDVSRSVASAMTQEELLALILKQLKPVVPYHCAAILTLAGSDLVVLVQLGDNSVENILNSRLPLAEALANNNQIGCGRPIIISDIYSDTQSAKKFRREIGDLQKTIFSQTHSWMGVPLIAKNRLVGVVSLAHNYADFYSQTKANLAMGFANQIAAVIENTRLYSKTRQHADELETVFVVQQAITSRLDSNAVLQLIADEARRLTNTELSLVYLLDDNKLRISVLSGKHNADTFVGYYMPIDGSAAGLALQIGQPLVINNVQNDSRACSDLAQRLKVQSYLAVPLISATRSIGVIAVADKREGSLGDNEKRILTMLASGATIGLENATLYQREQDRRHEAEQRRKIAESLRDILAVLNSNRSLDGILDYIAAQTSRLLGADANAIYQLDPSERKLVIHAARGLPENYAPQTDIPLGNGILGQAVLNCRPINVSDLTEALSKYVPVINKQHRSALQTLSSYFQAALAVPLIIKEKVYGGLVLYYQETHTFSTEEIDLAMTFADQVALAIENADLRTQIKEAAVTAERNRLARDLHDSVSQALFSANLVAEVLPQVWENNPEEAKNGLKELHWLTGGAMAEMRTLLLELRPSALNNADLGDLLSQLTQAGTARNRLPFTLNIDPAPPLLPDVKVALYRIAQEALNNVVKHANATLVIVELQVSPPVAANSEQDWRGQMIVRIIDDGCGFNPDHRSSTRLGLGIMRERAEAIGAQLCINSSPGNGTELSVTWDNKGESLNGQN